MYNPSEGLAINPNIQELVAYIKQELRRVSDSFRVMTVDGINYTVNYTIPTRVVPGMTVYFAADVVTTGALEGVYRVSTALTWEYIG